MFFLKPSESFPAVEKDIDAIAFLGHHVGDQVRNGRLVFDNQNASLARSGTDRRSDRGSGDGGQDIGIFSRGIKSRHRERGQFDRQGCAVAMLAFDAHLSAVLLHDSVHNRKTQAGANTRGFGGEKWIENTGDNFGRNPGAVVGNLDADAVARQPPGAKADLPRLAFLAAPLQDRLLGIDDQIENHLLELGGVREGLRQAGIEHEFNGDVFELQFVGPQSQSPVDDFIQIHGAALRLGFPGE